MHTAIGVLFLRIGKGSHALEACPACELHEFFEVLVGLAGESHHKCCAQMDARHSSSQLLDELDGILTRHVTMHTLEHRVGDVLQGDVEIATHVRLLTHHIEQLHWELVRISVVQTYPLHTRNVGHIADKVSDVALAVEVKTVVGELLGNDLKLAHALGHQSAHLLQDVFLLSAAMTTRDDGNGTIRTVAVAALADFQISIVAGRGERTHTVARPHLPLTQIAQQRHVVELPVVMVYLRDLTLQVGEIALRKTAHDIQSVDAAFVLRLGKLQNGLNAFLLGISDKATSVDDHDFASWAQRVVIADVTVSLELLFQEFAIDQVLRASQRDNVYLSFSHPSYDFLIYLHVMTMIIACCYR